jgi:hypothetical protein
LGTLFRFWSKTHQRNFGSSYQDPLDIRPLPKKDRKIRLELANENCGSNTEKERI